jgi:hypothetical protein
MEGKANERTKKTSVPVSCEQLFQLSHSIGSMGSHGVTCPVRLQPCCRILHLQGASQKNEVLCVCSERDENKQRMYSTLITRVFSEGTEGLRAPNSNRGLGRPRSTWARSVCQQAVHAAGSVDVLQNLWHDTPVAKSSWQALIRQHCKGLL